MIHGEFLSYLGKGGIFMYIRMMKKVFSYVYKEIEYNRFNAFFMFM